MTKRAKLILRRVYVVAMLVIFLGVLQLGHPKAAIISLLLFALFGLPIAYFLKWRR